MFKDIFIAVIKTWAFNNLKHMDVNILEAVCIKQHYAWL